MRFTRRRYVYRSSPLRFILGVVILCARHSAWVGGSGRVLPGSACIKAGPVVGSANAWARYYV